MKWKTMLENFGAAWQLLCWVGPPLLWILAFRTFPEFLGANLIKVLEARRSADLERLKGAISLSNSVEIERLKADLQSMSAIVKTSADFLTDNQSELRGRTINAADTLWEDMLRLRDAYSQLVFIDMILSSALTQTDGSGDRLTAARMSVAGLVQTKGLARRLCSAM
ncbi:hypothetical protein FHR71_002059 [Methylobacterium sp. RAS18]|nr:hypothetical protein [Methylobacterium sp. RAS18]